MIVRPSKSNQQDGSNPDAHITPVEQIRKTIALISTIGLLIFIFLKIVFF